MEGIGLGLARHILRHDPQLVVATSRSPRETQAAILKDQEDEETLSKRLRVLNLDVTKEDTIQSAREQVEDEFGKGNIKCLFNISGIVSHIEEYSNASYSQKKQ
jgi:NAD(P)-dependent dehydrogenase (short-subunit alcohol dehydrogenase family)